MGLSEVITDVQRDGESRVAAIVAEGYRGGDKNRNCAKHGEREPAGGERD